MNASRVIPLCLHMLFMSQALTAQNAWILKRDKEGIKISTRQSDRSRFNDIKVEMDLPGNIHQLADILTDVGRYNQWSYSTNKSVLVKKIRLNKLVYYSEIAAPWPVNNRDLYALIEINMDSVRRILNVLSIGDQNYGPPIKDMVRIPYSKGVWCITTVSNKIIHLNYMLEVDPGGSVPAWILNLFSTKGPLETFKNLKNKMILLNPEVKT